MLESYLALRTRIDRFLASVSACYSDQIVCHPGCAECCQAGLTLVMVEAVALGRSLGIADERILLQAGQLPLFTEGRCALLNPDNLCTAYGACPVICRTHGLPLEYPDREGVVFCEKNFVSQLPHSSAVLDMVNIETALFAANLDYCRRNGLNPNARVAVDRLVLLIKKD